MGNLSQRFAALPIGAAMLMPESGMLATLGDGSLWLKSGMAAAKTLFPVAANVETLKVNGLTMGSITAGIYIPRATTNGAGTWVYAINDATNLMVSTNSGATWATIAHNAGGIVTDVTWCAALGLFVCIGNTTSVYYIATSPTGATWTVRTGSAITSGTANTARITTDGTKLVGGCGGATTGGATTSTNGTAWTVANTTVALYAPDIIFSNSLFIFFSGTSTTDYMTSASGATGTWTSRTLPIGGAGGAQMAAVSGTIVCINAAVNTNNSYWTSTDAITWSATKNIGGNKNFPGGLKLNNVQSTGTYFLMTLTNTPNAFFYSSDGSTWVRRWSNGNQPSLVLGSGSNLIAIPNSTYQGSWYTTVFPSGDYVGSGYECRSQPTLADGNVDPIIYYRVK